MGKTHLARFFPKHATIPTKPIPPYPGDSKPDVFFCTKSNSKLCILKITTWTPEPHLACFPSRNIGELGPTGEVQAPNLGIANFDGANSQRKSPISLPPKKTLAYPT